MENNKKCSSKNHIRDAISFCTECDLYMCIQCLKSHSELFQNHHKYDLNEENQDFHSCICQEPNHKMELEYFCENHNKLCCAVCITKIKGNGKGQHAGCNICFITERKDKKKSKLNENIEILENYSKNIEQPLSEFKEIYKKMIESKGELKKKVSEVFTKIKYALNYRETELLLEIDNEFDNLYFKEDLAKQGEKLPNEIKTSLEEGKIINNDDYKIDKLNIIINGCLNIENNINKIQLIKDIIEKNNNTEITIDFLPKEEKEIDELINKIELFGKINHDIKEKIAEVDRNSHSSGEEDDDIFYDEEEERYGRY